MKIRNAYNFKMPTIKINYGFPVKYATRVAAIVCNKSVTEQISDLNYLGCNIT